MKFQNRYALIVLAAALSLLGACSQTTKEEKKAEISEPAAPELSIALNAEQLELAGIQTGNVTHRNLTDVVKLNGRIMSLPGAEALASTPFGGILRSATLLPGQTVSKGQVIATIENPAFIDMQRQYLEAQSRESYLKAEYERQQILRKDQINAAKTLQKIRADYQAIKAETEALRAKIKLAGLSLTALKEGKISAQGKLKAPISGVITAVRARLGQELKAGSPLFEIRDPQALYLKLEAFEGQIGKVVPGQAVRYALAEGKRNKRKAQVLAVSPAIGEDKTAPISCTLDDQDLQGLRAGMYAKAWVELGQKTTEAVPSEAIVQLAGKDYLAEAQKQNDGQGMRFTLIEVRKGVSQGGYTAVRFPASYRHEGKHFATKEAYTVLSALRNASEGEE